MHSATPNIGLLTTFTSDNLQAMLKNDPIGSTFSCHCGEFNSVVPTLLNPEDPFWKNQLLTIIWSEPEKVIPLFLDALSYKSPSESELLAAVDDYADMIISRATASSYIAVVTWAIPSYNRGFGIQNFKSGTGLSYLIQKMNLRLADALSHHSTIFVLDVLPWIAIQHAFNPKLEYMAKIPFSLPVFQHAKQDIVNLLSTLTSPPKKCIILDLDDTLWGGVVGDDGWESLVLGGHHPIGEAFVDFQHALKRLKKRGFILAICSKNEESVALNAIDQHPEMVLKQSDFVTWRINWNDKAQNIVDIANELNIGTDSIIFIDDNPIERDRVSSALPEVLVPDWPKDKLYYKSTLLQLSALDQLQHTEEDQHRSDMYIANKQRHTSKLMQTDDWLKSLDTTLIIDPLNKKNLPRATQLLNKTNQMNLSTRRLSEDDFWAWSSEPTHKTWTFRASDKFGDLGLIGIASIETHATKNTIVDFVLSCRVFNRKIEHTMLTLLKNWTHQSGGGLLSATVIPTPKNMPCAHFFESSDSDTHHGHTFTWNLDTISNYPETLTVQDRSLDSTSHAKYEP